MAWEENYRKERECPCGRGKYLEVHYSDDWNRGRTDMTMLCTRCRGKYVYDFSLDTSYHPRDEVERGWVLKRDFEKRKKATKEPLSSKKDPREKELKSS